MAAASPSRRYFDEGRLNLILERVGAATPDVYSLIGELEADLASAYEAEQRHGLSVERIFQPNIAFFIAYLDGQPIGCGGVAFEDGYAELKRMYVRPAVRGRGVVQALIARLEAEASARGIKRVTLETGDVQHAAIRAYERAGFARCGAFGDYVTLSPTAIVRSVFFEKRID
jgi:putative acetyltransferase